MASLADQYTYSQTVTFQNRVKVAMIAAAIAIQNESTTAATMKAPRYALAYLVLGNPTNYLPQFALAVANDATVSGKIVTGGATSTDTDTDIANAVSAAWNAVAAHA